MAGRMRGNCGFAGCSACAPGNVGLRGGFARVPAAAASSRAFAVSSSQSVRSTQAIAPSRPDGGSPPTRTGTSFPRSPAGSCVNAAVHSEAANREARYSVDRTAMVRSAVRAALSISATKLWPAAKSQAWTITE
jgi:hypothetical protein